MKKKVRNRMKKTKREEVGRQAGRVSKGMKDIMGLK